MLPKISVNVTRDARARAATAPMVVPYSSLVGDDLGHRLKHAGALDLDGLLARAGTSPAPRRLMCVGGHRSAPHAERGDYRKPSLATVSSR